ncbi:MAG: hypothetical protein LUG91_03745 [Ruminococcus sp.]|nr:hypothetical protein [Ruminococcus sp.]
MGSMDRMERKARREIVVDFLSRPQDIDSEIAYETRRLNELRQMPCTKSVRYDGMPRNKSGHSDPTALYVEKICEQEDKIQQLILKRVEVRQEVSDAIKLVKDERARTVLEAVFLEDKTYDEIMELLDYTEKSGIRKRYLQGLDAIVVPTDEALPDEITELMAVG